MPSRGAPTAPQSVPAENRVDSTEGVIDSSGSATIDGTRKVIMRRLPAVATILVAVQHTRIIQP
jgi:hypothetical protein